MSDGVRSRPPGGSPPLKRTEVGPPRDSGPQTPVAQQPAAGGSKESAAHDVFEAQKQAAHAQFKQQIQAVTSRSLRDLHFSSEELEAIAQLMLTFVKGHPNASRATRAKGFAKAILKGGKGKLGQVVEQMDKEQAERMFDDIGNMLSESPRLAEWVESVTEHLKGL